MAVVANYGRPAGTREDPGGFGGANKARDEWWEGQNRNNDDQGSIFRGGEYAANRAAGAQMAGPAVTENNALANNEASGAGGHQAGAISLADQLARGQVPSQAAMQLQSGLNQASAQQQSMAAGARGGAAMATAGANAQANQAAMQQNAWTQGGMLRARDMAQGRGLLGTALGEQRDQGMARLEEGNRVNQYNSSFADKSALNWGNAAVGFDAIGTDMRNQDQAWYQGGMEPIDAQSEATQQGQEWLADEEKSKNAADEEDG